MRCLPAAVVTEVRTCAVAIGCHRVLQEEMADVLRDAAAKLNTLKETVSKQKDGGGKSDAVVRAMTERHEREKAATSAEFDAFRKRAAAREKELQSDFNERLTTIKVKIAIS